VNERDMRAVLELAAQPGNQFIKEVFYLGCRYLGRATEFSYEHCLMPDEVIDSFERQFEGRITRRDIMRFQKLYFAFLHFWAVRKCFYVQHYLVLRDGRGGITPVNEVIDLAAMEPRLDRYRRLASRWPWLARAYLVAALAPFALNPRFLGLLREALKLKLLLYLGFDLAKLSSKTILLGFITACDPMILDVQLAANCGKGEVSMDLGRQEAGAWANVMREKCFLDRSHPITGPMKDRVGS
ncbi:hypothetical protein JW905_07095, partial [bacterium]|nr:hypothetical protein [candidate division CSSED10-310 bacterium]